MSFQKNDQSDFDFSIIDHKATQQGKLNFSVESLLTQKEPLVKKQLQTQQNQQQQLKNSERMSIKNIQQVHTQQNNSFLNDLQKFQRSLSFETQIYNVYHQQSNQQNNTKSYLHGKSNSHLKTTKQNSNDLMKSYYLMNQDDYGHLIIDFTKKKQKFKEIQNKKKLIPIQNSNKKLKTVKSMKSLLKTNNKISKDIITKTPKDKKQKKQIVRLTSLGRSKSKQYSIKTKITCQSPRNSTHKKLFSPKISGKSLYFDSLTTKNNTSSTTIQYSKDKKQTLNSLRQSNPYSQYFGVQLNSGQTKTSNKLSIASNSSSNSYKNIQINSPKISYYNKGNLIKKGPTKSKKSIRMNSPNSPSSKNQVMLFKKKKN